MDYNLRKINIKNKEEFNKIEEFLAKFSLKLEEDVDYSIAVVGKDEKILATASKAGKILKCFAVDESLRGENITALLVKELIDKLFEEGIYNCFLFTKPSNISIFEALNFKLISKVKEAALLEYGFSNIKDTIKKLIKENNIDKNIKKGAVVMNCNPFTKGHRYLIEKAAEACEELLVFIVEEDKSLFPFKYRYEIVKKSVADIKNVKVIRGTEYIISSATFPAYFLRSEDEKLRVYEELDCKIFAEYFGYEFNIVKRFVGTEPYCNVTNTYNETQKEILPKYNIELVEVERKKHNNEWISASKVRNLIKEGNLSLVRELVSDVTWSFLNSKIGKEIVEKIKLSNSPH